MAAATDVLGTCRLRGGLHRAENLQRAHWPPSRRRRAGQRRQLPHRWRLGAGSPQENPGIRLGPGRRACLACRPARCPPVGRSPSRAARPQCRPHPGPAGALGRAGPGELIVPLLGWPPARVDRQAGQPPWIADRRVSADGRLGSMPTRRPKPGAIERRHDGQQQATINHSGRSHFRVRSLRRWLAGASIRIKGNRLIARSGTHEPERRQQWRQQACRPSPRRLRPRWRPGQCARHRAP